jgi:drug/metabolite transporter (DMT)-like permease
MVVMLTAILFKQRITKRELFALVLTYAGVGLVVSHDLGMTSLQGSQTMQGIALVFASAITYAAYLVFSGRLIPRVGSSLFTAYTMLAATAASAGHFAATPHQTALLHLPIQIYFISIAMALVATVLPAVLLNAGIQRIGSNKASLVASVGPVSTIFLAYMFLGEDITWLQLCGTGLVMTGVWVIARHK